MPKDFDDCGDGECDRDFTCHVNNEGADVRGQQGPGEANEAQQRGAEFLGHMDSRCLAIMRRVGEGG